MTVKGALVLVVLAIAGVFAWHVSFRGQVVEKVMEIPSVAAVDRAVPITVDVNPVTNRVEVRLATAFAARPKGLIGKLGAAMGATLATEHWPAEIERVLREHAWAERDLYAMAIPYRAVVVDR